MPLYIYRVYRKGVRNISLLDYAVSVNFLHATVDTEQGSNFSLIGEIKIDAGC